MTAQPILRRATLADIPVAAALRAGAVHDAIITAEGMTTWLTDIPAEAGLLLLAADVDGATVGWCTASRTWFGSDTDIGMLDVTVAPGHQRRGLGSQLLAAALAHLHELGVHTVRASSLDGPAQHATARRFGFVESSRASMSAVDPRTVEAVPLPAGVTLVPFGDLSDPRPLYELDLEVCRDIPGDEDFDAMTLEHWTGRFWRTVFADSDASLAAYAEGELAGFTMLRVDRPSRRAQNNLTGVLRAYRGRGLARLLKSHSLRVAADAGATVAFTANDETNAPMLAVNRALGYSYSSTRIEWQSGAGRASA